MSLTQLSLFPLGHLFIYFRSFWVFAAALGLSLDAVSRGLLWSCGARAFPAVASPIARAQAPGLRALQLRRMDGHVGSAWARDHTYAPCTGRQTLNQWAPREVPSSPF